MSFARVTLLGNLTRDPELRYSQAGVAICKFSLAHNHRTAPGKESTSYFDIVVFDKVAEACNEYLEKGSAVLVDGEPVQDKWEDKEGKKRSTIVFKAFKVEFISDRQHRGGASKGKPRVAAGDDDIPF